MSSFFQTVPDPDRPVQDAITRKRDPWMIGIGVVAAVLIAGGLVTALIGLHSATNFSGTALVLQSDIDADVAVAIVGGVAVVLGLLIGTCWLVLGSIRWTRSH